MPHSKWCFFAAVFGNVTNRETAERLGGLVDLVITAVTPYEPHTTEWNGFASGQEFGSINVRNPGADSINSVTLKFEMHLRPLDGREGDHEPILIPYTKFSLFDLDEADGGSGRECVEARGYYNYAHSDPLIVKTQLTGKNTYDESTDTNSGRKATRLRPVPASRLGPERLPPPFQGNGALLGRGPDRTTRRKQWTLIMSRRADR